MSKQVGDEKWKNLGLTLYGKSIDSSTQEDPTREAMMNTLWFSYRKGIPPLKTLKGKEFDSDVGWGCVIRVAQMFMYRVLSETYQQHLPLKKSVKLELLNHFLDFPDRAFGIHKFCQHRQNQHSSSVEVGEFWKPNYALYTLKALWESCAGLYAQKQSWRRIGAVVEKLACDLPLERRRVVKNQTVQ